LLIQEDRTASLATSSQESFFISADLKAVNRLLFDKGPAPTFSRFTTPLLTVTLKKVENIFFLLGETIQDFCEKLFYF